MKKKVNNIIINNSQHCYINNAVLTFLYFERPAEPVGRFIELYYLHKNILSSWLQVKITEIIFSR